MRYRILKKFVDPAFGLISSPRFKMCKVYLDGRWKASVYDDVESEEYHLEFKNIDGIVVTLVFPTVKDRMVASKQIILNRPLELPYDQKILENISRNAKKRKRKSILKITRGLVKKIKRKMAK
jgi:hypothetical protein